LSWKGIEAIVWNRLFDSSHLIVQDDRLHCKCTLLHCTALHCTYCIDCTVHALYCTALHCTYGGTLQQGSDGGIRTALAALAVPVSPPRTHSAAHSAAYSAEGGSSAGYRNAPAMDSDSSPRGTGIHPTMDSDSNQSEPWCYQLCCLGGPGPGTRSSRPLPLSVLSVRLSVFSILSSFLCAFLSSSPAFDCIRAWPGPGRSLAGPRTRERSHDRPIL
jgi:hypothetical protein